MGRMIAEDGFRELQERRSEKANPSPPTLCSQVIEKKGPVGYGKVKSNKRKELEMRFREEYQRKGLRALAV